ncbi:MAG: hypothetical protein KDE32_10005 [Novosphingobium sp.]|nr:hypothetical protein [Novosphingobium sp.]
MTGAPSLFTMLDQGPSAPAVLPWDYVRMRRQAAGRSIEQAARPYWHRPEHQADVERNFRMFESVGFRLERGFYVVDMSRSHPLDIDIYRQLCTGDPRRHPRLCMACGWDPLTQSFDRYGDDVVWSAIDPGICTACEQEGRPRFEPRPDEFHPASTIRPQRAVTT